MQLHQNSKIKIKIAVYNSFIPLEQNAFFQLHFLFHNQIKRWCELFHSRLLKLVRTQEYNDLHNA